VDENSTQTGHRGRSVGFRSDRGKVLMSLMLTTGLIAVDATILATAVPSVVKELGEFEQFPWLFSVYLLAQAVSVPIYSKLADTIGRKPIILVGVGLFLLGSVLAGLAWNMTSLIVFRVVQGLGAGATAPMAMTIVGDIYTVAERALVQGYIASVWAVASVVGPALGGIFSQFTSWRWIFLVNIPLCLLAGWALARFYRENVERRHHTIDYLGAGLLTVGLTAVILALLEGGNAWSWLSWQSLTSFGIGIAALVAFVPAERRAAEPVLDLAVVRRPLIMTTTAISLGVGALLIGVTSFVPTYLENALGVVPLISGVAVAALTLGWPLSASMAGRLYLRFGYRGGGLRRPRGVRTLPEPVDGGRRVVRHRLRPGLDGGPVADRRAGVGRLERARRGDRHQRVRPLGRQRHRRGGVRCHRHQRDRRRPG
jgi:multidrug resistance protein